MRSAHRTGTYDSRHEVARPYPPPPAPTSIPYSPPDSPWCPSPVPPLLPPSPPTAHPCHPPREAPPREAPKGDGYNVVRDRHPPLSCAPPPRLHPVPISQGSAPAAQQCPNMSVHLFVFRRCGRPRLSVRLQCGECACSSSASWRRGRADRNTASLVMWAECAPAYVLVSRRRQPERVPIKWTSRGLALAGTRPQRGGGGGHPPPPLRTPKLSHGIVWFVGAGGAAYFVLGIRRGEFFLFHPMCLYSKYSEFCAEFKNGRKAQKGYVATLPTSRPLLILLSALRRRGSPRR